MKQIISIIISLFFLAFSSGYRLGLPQKSACDPVECGEKCMKYNSRFALCPMCLCDGVLCSPPKCSEGCVIETEFNGLCPGCKCDVDEEKKEEKKDEETSDDKKFDINKILCSPPVCPPGCEIEKTFTGPCPGCECGKSADKDIEGKKEETVCEPVKCSPGCKEITGSLGCPECSCKPVCDMPKCEPDCKLENKPENDCPVCVCANKGEEEEGEKKDVIEKKKFTDEEKKVEGEQKKDVEEGKNDIEDEKKDIAKDEKVETEEEKKDIAKDEKVETEDEKKDESSDEKKCETPICQKGCKIEQGKEPDDCPKCECPKRRGFFSFLGK